MSNVRVKKTSNYTVLDNYLIRDKRLTSKSRGLLVQMLAMPDDWDFTVRGLMHITNDGYEAIRTAMIELEKLGYVIREQRRDANGKMSRNEYTVFEVPQDMQTSQATEATQLSSLSEKTPENTNFSPQSENPTTVKMPTEEPQSGFPTTVFPTTENPTQLNTNIINTNISISSSSRVGIQAARARDEDEEYNAQIEKYRRKIRDADALEKARRQVVAELGEDGYSELVRRFEFFQDIRTGTRLCQDSITRERYIRIVRLIERCFGADAPSARLGGTMVSPEDVRQGLYKLTPDLILRVIAHVQRIGSVIANASYTVNFWTPCPEVKSVRAPDTIDLAEASVCDREEREERDHCG